MEESILLAGIIIANVFSFIALCLSIGCFIKIMSVELSKTEFIQMDSKELFETDMDKINESLIDDEIDKEIDKTFEPDKPFNEVIL